jgi:hypothetical protein
LLLAFSLHLLGISRESLWRDEVDSIRFAAEIWETMVRSESIRDAASELARYLTRPGWNGPLYFWALEPWLRVAGRSELALRFPSALAGLVAIALSYAVASRLFGMLASQLTALLIAANPYLAWYAGEGKMYTLITALALLSTYLLLRALASGQKRFWLGYVLATTVLFYCHVLTPLLLPVQFVLALLLHPRAARAPAALLSVGALILPYLPLLVWQWPRLAEPAETGFPFVTLPAMARRLAEVFGRGIIGWPAAAALALLLSAMGASMILAKRRAALGLLCWAVIPLLELYLVSLRRPLFTERYLIWSLPAWLMLAGAGLAALAERGGASHRVSLVWTAGVVTTGMIGVAFQWGTPVRADFRAAAAFVRQHHQAGELIVFQIPYLKATFDYYAPELEYQSAEGPYTNRGDSPADWNTSAQVDAYLRQATAGYPRIWLVLSEAPMWDERDLTRGWFDTHGRLAQQLTLNRVEVTQWKLGNRSRGAPATLALDVAANGAQFLSLGGWKRFSNRAADHPQGLDICSQVLPRRGTADIRPRLIADILEA